MPTTDDIVRFANISVPTITFDKAVPPSFIVQAQDGGCKVQNAIAYYTALTCAGVKAEMHSGFVRRAARLSRPTRSRRGRRA